DLDQRSVADRGAFAYLHQQHGALAPFRVRPSDHRRERNPRHLADDLLDLGGVDPLAAGLDQVLGAPGDHEVAVGLDAREVAGIEPAVVVDGWTGLAEVALDGAGTAHAQV